MPRTRGQQRRTEPPPAGWRDQDATDDESEYDPNDQLLEDYDDEDNFENEQDEDIFEEEFESVGQCESGASRFVQECDETDSPASSKNWTLILILLTLVLVPVGSFYLYPNESFDFVNNSIDVVNIMRYKLSSPSNESENEAFVPSTPWDKFKHKFKTEFTPKYLNAVPKSSIKVIKAAVKDVMTAHEDSDKYEKLSPSVILILGKEGNKNVTCFSRDLERIISSSYNEGNPVRLKGDSIDASGIEAAFIDVFENKKQHLIVIDGLNKLDGKSAAHLHRFTDHELSVFKEAIIILLGYTDEVAELRSESSMKDMDSVASSLIMKLWAQTLPGDTIAPLISRLTPSVTAVLDWDGKVTIC